MMEKAHGIILSSDLAVLATCAENQPHCSLMAYVSSEDCRKLYMMTLRDSRKFRNISANPGVSVMVDTRMDNPGRRESIMALTIGGTCRPAPQSIQAELMELLLHRHPQLQGLGSQKDTVVMEIAVHSFLLLDGVNDAWFQNVSV